MVSHMQDAYEIGDLSTIAQIQAILVRRKKKDFYATFTRT